MLLVSKLNYNNSESNFTVGHKNYECLLPLYPVAKPNEAPADFIQ